MSGLGPRQSVNPIAAEARAVESGHRAWRQADGSFKVASLSEPDISRRVTYEAVALEGTWLLRCKCDCPSGQSRPADLLACWHGALVGRRLEREGYVAWVSGRFELTGKALRIMDERAAKRRAAAELWPEPPKI